MQAKLEAQKRDVEKDVWQSYYSFETSKENLLSSKEYLSVAVESESHAREGYKLGAFNVIDLITAQSQLADADEKYISATFEKNIAKIQLLKSIGNLHL